MGAEAPQFNKFVHKSALEDYKYMASRYWPGPLTIIIPISEESKSLFNNKMTLGLRIPNSKTVFLKGFFIFIFYAGASAHIICSLY